LQKLLGTINWVWPMLDITNEEMSPLFNLLKGDTDLLSARTLTKEAHLALEMVADKISSYNAAHYVEDLPMTLFVINSAFQPFAILGQAATDGEDVYFL
ncbi:POK8 protein, partial [Oriolus oriolus]|nr:POK8 protein [Oriolus oriolus]NXO13456.1 POK8 protein [Oriolus oriolus]